ncbi:MAG: hypothetical protein JWN47_2142, partial [Frankiales bacterium]|nr:hypothetical protein [Frankiales bacterium]
GRVLGITADLAPSAGPTHSVPRTSTVPERSPAGTPSTTTPAPQPMTATNTPDGVVEVTAIRFDNSAGLGTQVSIEGLRATGDVLSTGRFDWGDGTVLDLATQPLGDPNNRSWTHTYTGSGGFVISLRLPQAPGSAADGPAVWTHPIQLPATAPTAPTPDPELAPVPDAGGQRFTMTEGTGCAWTSWTLDYGDGSYVSGDDAHRPTDAQSVHSYTQAGAIAVLTVVAADGQVGTSMPLVVS